MPALRVICCWLGETLRTLRLSRRLVCGLLGRPGDELITRRAASLMACREVWGDMARYGEI